MKILTTIFVSSAALLTPVRSAVESGCTGVQNPDKITKLDFFESNVTVNTLHLEGGELRYDSEYIKSFNRSESIYFKRYREYLKPVLCALHLSLLV
jgi:hypothetical protein